MKSVSYISLLALSVMLAFSSCTIQKRVHRSGIHIEWNKSGKKPAENYMAGKHLPKEQDDHEKNGLHIRKIEGKKEEVKAALSNIEAEQFPVMASCDASVIILHDKLTAVADYIEPVAPVVHEKLAPAKKFAKKAKPSETHSLSDDDGTKTLGWVFIFLGLIILLFVSILIGLIILVLGIVFAASDGKSKEEPKEEMVDVVYLKNGSIIRGMIIEQIPNDKLKIKTSDGSVFVYKMNEIEKITKESK